MPNRAWLRRGRSALTQRARLRLSIVAICAVALAIAASARLGPLTRLANYKADGPGPIYDNPGVDDRILRRAASLLPRGDTYSVFGEPIFDLQGGALLYFPPALQIPNGEARWVLSYHAPQLLPSGLRSLSVHRVAKGVYLIRVARA